MSRWWQDRKGWFFKPRHGFGSRGVYRGDKMTRRVFAEVVKGEYLAQELTPPSERQRSIAGNKEVFKIDVRCYVYAGKIQRLAARLYQGQTTNFRTAGGGFAPIYVVDNAGHDDEVGLDVRRCTSRCRRHCGDLQPLRAEQRDHLRRRPVSAAEMARRVAEVQKESLPWLVATRDSRITGFAYAQKWKTRAAYRHSAEVTVYVRPGLGNSGIGSRALLRTVCIAEGARNTHGHRWRRPAKRGKPATPSKIRIRESRALQAGRIQVRSLD